MNKINKIYLLIIAIAFLASCEKPVTNVDVPEVEAQLVLFSFISPENNYTAVSVSLSQPIFGKKMVTVATTLFPMP